MYNVGMGGNACGINIGDFKPTLRGNTQAGDPASAHINGDSLAVRNPPVGGPQVQDAPVRVHFTEKRSQQATEDKGPKLPGMLPPKDQALQEQALNSVEAAESLMRLAADPNPARGWALNALNRVAENSTNEEVLRRLARLENNQLYNSVLLLVGRNRHTPPEALQGLAAGEDPFVVAEVAGNPRTPGWVLADLARYSAPGPSSGASQWQLTTTVHEQVACNPSTPQSVLADLALSDNLCVLHRVARNQRTPVSTLERLAAGTDEPALIEAHEARLRRIPYEEERKRLRREFPGQLGSLREAAVETLIRQAGGQGNSGPKRQEEKSE